MDLSHLSRPPLVNLTLIVFLLMYRHLSVAQQQKSTTPLGSPIQMHLCIATTCETLVWRGDHYDGVKDNTADVSTRYTVERWSQTIRLKSKSSAPVSTRAIGPVLTKVYLEGVFTGDIATDGHSIDAGLVNWHVGRQGGAKVFSLTWDAPTHAVAELPACSDQASAQPKPSALEVCDGPCIWSHDGNLGAWTFQGDKGTAHWPHGNKAELTIKKWAGGEVVISREDTPDSQSAGATVIYRGSYCSDVIKGIATVHWPGHFDEKDVDVPWMATVPVTSCEGLPDDAVRLVDVAQAAFRFRKLPDAFKCLSRAAALGDRDSRTATGLMYRDGVGTQVSYPDALKLFQEGAIQGDYNAQVALSQMYDLGLGVPVDSSKAKEWARRAYENPLKVAERQRTDQQENAQKLAFLGLSAIVEAMARPTVYVAY